jgi:hypothetical protein
MHIQSNDYQQGLERVVVHTWGKLILWAGKDKFTTNVWNTGLKF